jgi:hypothetical protein
LLYQKGSPSPFDWKSAQSHYYQTTSVVANENIFNDIMNLPH